jgi:hypothetical protein
MPATILFVSANPTNSSRLDLDDEYRTLSEEQRRPPTRHAFELVSMPAARREDLARGLTDHAPQIVHFGGHGQGAGASGTRDVVVAEACAQRGDLVVRDHGGLAITVPGDALVELFRLARLRTRLVVLNACHTAQLAESIARHVDCVIGTTGAISDRAAIAFSRGFYAAAFTGRSVGDAFELGRNEIRIQSAGDPDIVTLCCRPGIAAHDVVLGELLGPLTFHVLIAAAVQGDPPEAPRAEELGAGGRRVLALLGDAISWDRYVAAVASIHVPSIVAHANGALAEHVARGLATYLAQPGEAGNHIPAATTLFANSIRSAHDVASFLAAVLPDRAALDLDGSRELLEIAGEQVVHLLYANEPPPRRRELEAVAAFVARRQAVSARIVLAFRAERPTTTSDHPGQVLRLELHDGELTFLVEQLPRAHVDPSLEALAAAYDHEFSAKAIDSIPLFEKLYVEPSVLDEKGQAENLFERVDRWLDPAQRVPMVLMGDPGSGKSSACLAIVHRQLERVRTAGFSELVAFPILIPVRSLRRDCVALGKKAEYELAEVLYRICIDHIAKVDLQAKGRLAHRRLLFVLDGFDELGLVDEHVTQTFLEAIGRLPGDKERVSILLTGRTFALAPRLQRIDANAFDENRWIRSIIQPFTIGAGSEVERFVLNYMLAARRDKVTSDILERVTPQAPFSEVARTPVVLAMLCAFYHRIGELPVASDRKTERVTVLNWLVRQAVAWRANPNATEREPLSKEETAKRLAAFQSWAWDAFRDGGTDFTVSSLAVPNDAWLVEFFVKPSEGGPGKAAFVHRTIAEYLAATRLIERMIVSDASGSDTLLQFCQELAVEDRLLEVNFKDLMAQYVATRSPEQRKSLAEATALLVASAYGRPGGLRWHARAAPLLATLGWVAELACTIQLAANDGRIDSDLFGWAARLRTASPRRHHPWQLATAIRELTDLDLSAAALNGLDLSRSQLEAIVFSKHSMLGCNLAGATLTRCTFSADSLAQADVGATVFISCTFRGTRLCEALLADTVFVNCRFDRSKVLERFLAHTPSRFLESAIEHVRERFFTERPIDSYPFLSDHWPVMVPEKHGRTWVSMDDKLAPTLDGDHRWLTEDGVGWDYDREHKQFFIEHQSNTIVLVSSSRKREYEVRLRLSYRDTKRDLAVEIWSSPTERLIAVGAELAGTRLHRELQPFRFQIDIALGTVPSIEASEEPRLPSVAEQLLAHAEGALDLVLAERTNHRFLALRTQ